MNVLLATPIVALVALVALSPGSREEEAMATSIRLPEARTDGTVSVEGTLHRRRSVRDFRDAAISLEDLAQILWAAQGITSGDGDRTAPSAGALFPIEITVIAGDVGSLAAGAYRYDPHRHALDPVDEGDLRRELAGAALDQECVADGAAVLVIAAVTARTAAKYGSRAERYVALEAGHVSQNVYLQAVALGLGTVAVGAFEDASVSRVAGLPRGERPLYLMPLGRPAGAG